jgi:hypothetical protein
VDKVVIGEVQAKAVEERLVAILLEDQKARQPGSVDLTELNRQDVQRRKEVLEYLAAGELASGQALYAAAMVLQHGNCAEHYRWANELAGKAVEQGMQEAKWLYAATLDRYLLSQGKPQKFGTQYQAVGDRWKLLPVDPATTDEERARYDLPPLSEAKNLRTPVPTISPPSK